MGRTKKTITLEDYEHLLDNPREETFTVDQLNEVIFMHGFQKLHKGPKRDLYEALSTIDLIKPQRSTLKDDFSPHDFSFSVDQVMQDLEALNWPECFVQSIETIGKPESGRGGDVVSNEVLISSFKISGKRQRSNWERKTKRMRRTIADDDGAAHRNIAVDVEVDGNGGAGTEAAAALYDSSLFVDTYSWEF